MLTVFIISQIASLVKCEQSEKSGLTNPEKYDIIVVVSIEQLKRASGRSLYPLQQQLA